MANPLQTSTTSIPRTRSRSNQETPGESQYRLPFRFFSPNAPRLNRPLNLNWIIQAAEADRQFQTATAARILGCTDIKHMLDTMIHTGYPKDQIMERLAQFVDEKMMTGIGGASQVATESNKSPIIERAIRSLELKRDKAVNDAAEATKHINTLKRYEGGDEAEKIAEAAIASVPENYRNATRRY